MFRYSEEHNISLKQTAREIACGAAKVGRWFEMAIFAWGLRAAERTDLLGLDEWLSERWLPRAAAQLICYEAQDVYLPTKPCYGLSSRHKG